MSTSSASAPSDTFVVVGVGVEWVGLDDAQVIPADLVAEGEAQVLDAVLDSVVVAVCRRRIGAQEELLVVGQSVLVGVYGVGACRLMSIRGEADGRDRAREVNGAAGGPGGGVVRREVEAVPHGGRVGLTDESAQEVVGAGASSRRRSPGPG